MPDATSPSEAVLEVVAPDGTRRIFRVTHTPFLIGRGAETNNDLQLPDLRISRQCAAIVEENGALMLEDRGHRRGLFVNGQRIERSALKEGDAINFGLDDSFELVFHATAEALPDLLSRMENLSITGAGSVAGTSGLRKLSLLLEATALLHSHLPLDSILGNMVDHAIALTGADRGLLVERGADNVMRVRLARQRGGKALETAGLEPTQTAIRHAIEQKRAIITEDLDQAHDDFKSAKSIIMQRLRSLAVIPLYAFAQNREGTSPGEEVRGELLGVLYLDSTRPAGFSTLERQILDALAVEAASVMDNARMVERERERERLEQELGIAREIQQALLPRDFHTAAHLQLSGMNKSCLTVGGDYFDVMELGPGRTAFLIADVSGKGLGAALLTTMLQGAFSGMAIQQPADVFGHINNFICSHSRLERYATVFFAILSEDGQLEYINAGHPSPVLLRAGRAEIPFAAKSFPVGLIPDAVYELESHKLEPGDTLVLFSDGVTEAMDPEDNEFGNDRLKQSLEAQHRDAIEDVQTDVLAAVSEFARGASQRDDITLVVARYLGARQAAQA